MTSETTGERLKSVLLFVAALAGVVLLNVSTLLRGTPPLGSCGTLVPFLPGLDRFQNCDTPLFNQLAQQFDLILGPEGMTRQGRPGFMALGWIADRALWLLSFGRYDPLADGAPGYVSAEWGYLLLNALVLALAAVVLIRLVGPAGRRSWGVTALCLVLLTANPVTRAFFWTAHSQMFNLLVPPLAIGIVAWALQTRPSRARVALVGLVLGLCLTVYGSFTVVVAAVAIALLLRRQVWSAVIFLATAAAPAALWWLYVTSMTGTFYSVETSHYRQFVWILDGLKEGGLLSKVRANTGWMLTTFADSQTFLAIGLLLTIVAVIAIGLLSPSATRPEVGPDAPAEQARLGARITAVGIVLPVQITFIWLMGFYQTRLSWGIVTTAITTVALIAALAATRLDGGPWLRRINIVGLVMALVWLVTWSSIPGPWH